MKNNFMKSRNSYRKKFGASFFATILILTAITTISVFSAPAGAVVCLPPVADANGPYFGYTGEAITLDGSGSYDPDGVIVLYEWDFDGDGTYDWSSPSTGITTHSYGNYGTYDAVLRVTDDCGETDTDTGTVTIYHANPPLAQSCGIDIVLVIDGSGSIDPTKYSQMQTAFVGFVNAFLPNTPTEMAIVEFATLATVRQGFTSDATTLINEINGPRVQPGGEMTNWEQGLLYAHNLFPNRDKPDLIVFASDGDPNRQGNPASSTNALGAAIDEANSIKFDGIRIITLGIGSSVNSNNLKAISSADAYYDSDFDTLADTLVDIANELCGGTVTVRKWVDDVPAEGWEFTATVDGGYAVPSSGTTDANGYLTFTIEFDQDVDTAYVDITETLQAGYNLVTATAVDCAGAPVGTLNGLTIQDIPVTKDCLIYCEFLNEEVTDDCPPETTKTFNGPTYGPENFWVTTSTLITLTAVDCPIEEPSGIDFIHYEIWWDSDGNGIIEEAYDTKVADETVYSDTVTFSFTEECLHLIKWYAVDLAGNQEETHYQYHRVDDTGPEQSIVLGEPQLTDFYLHSDGNYYTVVGPNTPIYLTSDDTHEGTKDCAVGSHSLTYFYHWGYELNEWEDSEGPFTVKDGDPEDINDEPGIITVVIYMDESCWHEMHLWCEDELGNQGTERFVDFIVDADRPLSSYDYIGPNFWDDDEDLRYVHCSTVKRINVTDVGCIEGGSGVEYIQWWVQRIIEGGSVVTIADGIIYDGDSNYYFNNGLVVVTGEYDPDYGEMQIEITVLEHCAHYIFYHPYDYVDNGGTIEKQKVKVDCKPPITTKTIGDPQFDEGHWVTTSTLMELNAVDQEEPCAVGVEEIHYRYGYDQDDSGEVEENEFDPWVTVSGDYASFFFTEECLHKLEWYAVDLFGNTEETHVQYHKVDDTPPYTTKTIGDPKYDSGYWVTTWSLFELDATDLPPGCPVEVDEIYYRIGWDENEDQIFDESEFYPWVTVSGDHAEFFMPEECYHKLEWYSVDNLGNVEDTHIQHHRVDDTPPETVKTFNGPTCGVDDYWVKTSTAITLTATDLEEPCAVGVWYIHYEIWWDSNNDGTVDTLKVSEDVYDTTVTFWFTEECLHEIRWYAVDYLGNTETEHTQQHRVDDSAPQTVKSFSGGATYGLDDYWLTLDTEITLTATDYTEPCAVGGVTLFYEVWWDSDNDDVVDIIVPVDVISYDDDYVTFKFLEECLHEIRWYAVDCLGNTELLQTQQHRVDDTPPETLKTFIGPTYDDPVYGADYWLQDHGTTIILDATDKTYPCDVGVEYLYVELWKSTDEGYSWNLIWEEQIVGDHYEFVITEDCYHAIVWWAVDYLGNSEGQNVQFHQVDSQPPITTKTVNDPECQDEFYVTTSTLIELDAVDQEEPCAVGVEEIHYRYGYDQDGSGDVEENEFDPWVIVPGDYASFYFTKECYHKLEWFAVDYLTNTEETHEQYHRVDDSAPITVKTFSGPVYMDNYWVTLDTEITLTATDYTEPCAVGGVTLFYEVWFDSDYDGVIDTQVDVDIISEGDDYVTFKFLEECLHEIRWYAVDCLGNTELLQTQQHRVDNSAPETLKTFIGPTYGENNYWLQDHGTTIVLDATDKTYPCDVGVDYIHVELWWFFEEQWTQIFSRDIYDDHYEFVIEEDCLHEIRWYAVDYLENEEDMHYQQHRVDSQPPITTKSFDGPRCPATEEDIIKFELTQEEIPNFWLRDYDTWVILNAVDQLDPCAVGVDYIHAELWNSIDEGETWDIVWIQDIPGDFYEFQIMEDCLHKIIWYAVDYLTNTEDTHVQYHRVDSIPPESVKTFDGPTYPADDSPNPDYGPDEGENYWVTSDTEITLTAEDHESPCDVGVIGFYVMVEWDWDCDDSFDVTLFDEPVPAPYTYTFTFKELVDAYYGYEYDCYEGDYRITWSSFDCLGNTEEEKIQYHRVDDTGPHVVILKPVDGWYSDGECIPAVVFSEDLNSPHCGYEQCGTVGIEDGKQGYAYLIDIFPEFKIVELDSTNFLYDADSHEFIGNVCIPEESGLTDGIVLFVAGVEDNLGNDWDSIREMIHAIVIQALAEYMDESGCMELIADLWADFVIDQNLVFIGIDNTPPVVEIIEPSDEGCPEVGLGPIHVYATIEDALSGVTTGTPCYVSLDGIQIGTLFYNSEIGGCEGNLPIPMEVLHGEKLLTVAVADVAGTIGYDTICVEVGERPGPTTSGVEVQPDPSMIQLDGTGEQLTVTATVHSTIAYVTDAEFYIDDKEGTPIALDPVMGQSWGETMVDVIGYFNTDDMTPGVHVVYARGMDEHNRWGAFDEEEFNLVLETHWRPIFCEITEPEEDDEFDMSCRECCERYITAIVDVHYWDDWTYSDMEDLIGNVKVWLDSPYGAPDLYFDVDWDGDIDKFTAQIPVYMYSSGSILDLEAKAQDQWGNKEYDDVQIQVFTTIVYDQWMELEWNKLSLPQYAIACDNTVESVLASIDDGNFDLVFYYDGTDWFSWAYGIPGDTLTHMFTGEEYWIHIVGEPVRFYTDTSGPYVEITDPEDEYDERCEGPGNLNFRACDIETEVIIVYTQIYDHNGLYWDGEVWQSEPVWLECDFDEEDNGWSYWSYDSEGIWSPGHTYDISAKAVDAAGCESEIVTHTLYIYNPSILVEKTVGEEQEELTIPIETEFTFTIYVENDGDIELYDIDVYDYLPPGITYLPGGSTVEYNGEGASPYEPEEDDGELYWSLDDLEPGEYAVIQFNAMVTTCDVWEENTAEVYADSDCDVVSDEDHASVMGIDECEPDIDVGKKVWREDMGYWNDYTEQDIEDIVTFNISMHNDGSCLFTGLYVVDDLPAGLAYVPDSTVVTFLWDAENMYEQESGPEVQPNEQNNPDGSTTLTWGEQTGEPDVEFGLPYCAYIYIEFDVQVVECGYHTNEVYAEAYYTCCDYDWGDGSAEVWVDECPEVFDFGDAPDEYGTLLASDGARHEPFAPYMGVGSDLDSDGQPTIGADGDDDDGNDDEDGITFNGPYYPGDLGNVDIDMTWTPADGYLNAWIDFNQDGDFDDAGEQIFTDEYLTNGIIHYGLTFSIPPGALLGDTYARFRINSLGGLTYTGAADDGEVEDYVVLIEEEEPPCEPLWDVTKETWCYDYEMWGSYGMARDPDNHAKFRIIFENIGTCPITDFVIEDELPDTLVFDTTISVTVPGGSGITHTENYDAGNNIITWDFTGTLLPGEQVIVEFEANFVGAGECDDTNWAIGQPDGYMGIIAYSDIYYWCEPP